MKKILLNGLIIVLLSCNNKPSIINEDLRPKEQVGFLRKYAEVKELHNYEYLTNEMKKDSLNLAFNQYLKDSLSQVKQWRFKFNGASTFEHLDTVYYVIGLVAPISYKSASTNSLNDSEIEFNSFIPKEPINPKHKAHLQTLLSLNQGDNVSVSGNINRDKEHQLSSLSLFTVEIDSIGKVK